MKLITARNVMIVAAAKWWWLFFLAATTVVIVVGEGVSSSLSSSSSSRELELNCDDCGYVRVCFGLQGCSDYKPFIHAWINTYASCNSGRYCGPCFTDVCLIQDHDTYKPPVAGVDTCNHKDAGVCFTDAACTNYNYSNEYTKEYANCNGLKGCAPYFPDNTCVFVSPSIDYSPPYQKLQCKSESEFRNNDVVYLDDEGLTATTCKDIGLLLNPFADAIDCSNDEQRTTFRERQLACCGGAEFIETIFCPEYIYETSSPTNTPVVAAVSSSTSLSSPTTITLTAPTPDSKFTVTFDSKFSNSSPSVLWSNVCKPMIYITMLASMIISAVF